DIDRSTKQLTLASVPSSPTEFQNSSVDGVSQPLVCRTTKEDLLDSSSPNITWASDIEEN
ncbi:MAG: hypothetical protein VX757_05995, partial [Planctomycetota bacterium]|nr:hypothetical protein [Planctomycetota bacterium]